MRRVVRFSITIGAAAALFLTPAFGGTGSGSGNGNGNGNGNGPHARSVTHGRGRVLGVVQQTNLGHIDQSDAQTALASCGQVPRPLIDTVSLLSARWIMIGATPPKCTYSHCRTPRAMPAATPASIAFPPASRISKPVCAAR